MKYPSERGYLDPIEYNSFVNTYKKIHSYVHFQKDEKNIFGSSHSHIKIRNEYKPKTVSFVEMKEISLFFFKLIKFIILQLFRINFNDNLYQFDKDLYNDGGKCWDVEYNRDKMIKTLNTKCEICGKGEIKYPDSSEYPFGPYLICNNSDCGAILSKNMNLKKELEELCSECNKKINMKITFSYSNNQKYNECLNCGKKLKK